MEIYKTQSVILFTPYGGSNIHTFIPEVLEIVNKLQIIGVFGFNGRHIKVHPGDTEDKVFKSWKDTFQETLMLSGTWIIEEFNRVYQYPIFAGMGKIKLEVKDTQVELFFFKD